MFDRIFNIFAVLIFILPFVISGWLVCAGIMTHEIGTIIGSSFLTITSTILYFVNRKTILYNAVSIIYPHGYHLYWKAYDPFLYSRYDLLKTLRESGIKFHYNPILGFNRHRPHIGVTLFFKSTADIDYIKLAELNNDFDMVEA